MLFDVPLAGFEGHRVQVGVGLREPAYLLVDGLPPTTGAQTGEYVIQRNDGTPVTATVRRGRIPLDPVPELVVAAQHIEVRPPLTAPQVIWSGLALLLWLVSGPLGLVVGAIATVQNLRTFRRGSGRYGRTLAVTAAAALLTLLVSLPGAVIGALGDQGSADREVAHFHERFNSGSFDIIVAQSDPLFTSKASPAAAADFLSAIRSKLGSAGSAHLESWTENKQLNGSIGTGTFLVMTYTTQFTNGAGKEQFIWRVEDGRTLLVGYHVESDVFLR